MYQSFAIVNIDTIFSEKKIVVYANFDIDSNSVNDNTVQVHNSSSKNTADVELVTANKTITILFREDIVLNSDYIIKISGLKTILGDELQAGMRRRVVFETMVREVPRIVEPADHQEIDDIKVTLKAILENKEVELEDKTYLIQIANDVAFINIVLETETIESTIKLERLKAGQYFIRARVEEEELCGNWSEITSFISIAKDVKEPIKDDEPTYVEEVLIVDSPVNGETPESIIIEFTDEIDPESIYEMIVIRRDI